MRAYATTDVGRVRRVNQDYIFCSMMPVGKLPNLFIVADGMGGHKAGDLASRFTVETLINNIKNSSSDNPITIINDAIVNANTLLLEISLLYRINRNQINMAVHSLDKMY